MKSHPCVKTTGGGVSLPSEPVAPVAPSQPVTTHQPVTLTPCRYINRRNQHCRLFSSIPNLELCPHHARQQQLRKQRLNDASAAELLCDVEDFSTPNAVNALLGNLVRQLARKRIQRRDAMAIAYVSQLLLSSMTALDRYEDRLEARNADPDSDIPRIIFDRPDPHPPAAEMSDSPGPISDSTKLPVPFTTAPFASPKNNEGRA
jgi:hypothetical protein